MTNITENLTTSSFYTVTATLGAVAVFSAIRSLTSKTSKKKLSNATAALINVIAFIHYTRMTNMWSTDKNNITGIRYSDWFITCPLLLFEFFILMDWIYYDQEEKLNIKDNLTTPIIITVLATLAMLFCGYLSEKYINLKWQLFTLAFIFLIIIFAILINTKPKKRNDKNSPKYPWIFIGLWVLYGFSYLSKNKNIFYNILDLIAKGLFAFIIGLN